MIITRDLIDRFFQNQCSPEERQQVWAFLKANPEEIAQYMDEKEWESFEPGEKMDEVLSKKLLSNVERQTYKSTGRIRTIYRIAIAASVAMLFGFTWMFFNPSDKQEVPIAQVDGDKVSDSIKTITRHESNHTGKDKTIHLEDGSLIILSNNSEITYKLPFTNSRDITLVGKAFFKVAKDKTRPFMVTSGDITTTALGTEFTVSAQKSSGRVVVRLYEGKIVIREANRVIKRMNEDVYLSPGQEFVYGGQTPAKVYAFKANSNAGPEEIMAEEQAHDNPSVPDNTKGTWFQFNNRPLSEIFDQLAEIYHVKIVYNKKDVRNLYFIGKYNSTDSVETILRRIGTLNHLTITRNDTTFIISK